MTEFLSLYTINDGIEISVCSIAYYMINRWLYSQENKHLLKLWYGYHLFVMVTYAADLQTLFFLSACYFPVVLMLAVIFNEQRLQKMFITAQRLDPLTTTTSTSHWVDELMKFLLMRLNEQKELLVVIEYQHSLAPLIHAQEIIHADVKKNTLELLYDTFSMPKDAFLWITHTGTIVSLAAELKNTIRTHDTPLSDTIIHITHATDCIALKSCAVTRTFTIITGAKIVERLSAHHALNILYELQAPVYTKEAHNAHEDNFTRYNNTHIS